MASANTNMLMDGVVEKDCNHISWNSWICQLQLIVFDSILIHSIFLFKVKHYAYFLYLFRLKKTKEKIATAINYQVRACREDGAMLSLYLCIRSIRENRKVIITCKGKTKTFTMRLVRYWSRMPGGFAETPSLRILKTWLNKVQSSLTWLWAYHALSGEWDQMTSTGPVSLNCFMILWLYTFLLGTCQWDIRNQINNRSFWTLNLCLDFQQCNL